MRKSKLQIQYDECVKCFLAQKVILAHILVETVEEFEGCTVEEVVQLIEGDPDISRTRVDAEGTEIIDYVLDSNSSIIGMNTEDSSVDEGVIYYDIRFYVYTPDVNFRTKMLINIEAQNDFKLDYDIATRGVYYSARMISSQKGTEFVHSQYNDIKKVYSIWICTSPSPQARNIITTYSMKQSNLVGDYPEEQRYDLLSVVLVGLDDKVVDQSRNMRLHRLLEIFFTTDLTMKEKVSILEKEYGIVGNVDVERSVNEMCNVSEGLINRGRREGKIEGKIEMLRELQYTVEEIAEKLKMPIEKVEDTLVALELS